MMYRRSYPANRASAKPCPKAPDSSPATSGAIFFFNDTATTEIYTLSLHDALPISPTARGSCIGTSSPRTSSSSSSTPWWRSEEHTSELQSRLHLVCRLLLEKKKQEMLSVVTGDPREIADEMLTNPYVDLITFTGGV